MMNTNFKSNLLQVFLTVLKIKRKDSKNSLKANKDNAEILSFIMG